MNKEKIENFDKEQLELLLNDLKDIDKYTNFKNGAFIYDLGHYQGLLLVNEINRLRLIIKAIKEQCDVTESYEINEFIRQLENEPADSRWLKRVAGDDNEKVNL